MMDKEYYRCIIAPATYPDWIECQPYYNSWLVSVPKNHSIYPTLQSLGFDGIAKIGEVFLNLYVAQHEEGVITGDRQ